MFRLALLLSLMLLLVSVSNASTRYWVFFKDKGVVAGQEQRALDNALSQISERSIARRLKNHVPLANFGDMQVCKHYVDQVHRTGAQVRVVSKWLNAVSVEANDAQLAQVRALSCVLDVERFSRRLSIEEPVRVESSALDSAEYGNSYRQNAMCRIPELHARGLSGRGVLLCMLDTGFMTDHVSLVDLNYLAMRDFIFGDSIVHNEEGQDSSDQHLHGTAVLSAAAGLDSNNIIGPAYGATWMLAKTEYVPTETAVEEDFYVAGMEWADSAGAEVTSSSLGYIDWYTQDQMDGRTTVVARAVTEAQRRGILVVTAEGNEGQSAWGTVISPADADSILAIGGVDSTEIYWPGSSPGPTADGRMKPDICAQSSETFCAAFFGNDAYWRLSGTSLATPIVAGICALVMEANPDWTAQQVRDAILATGSQANSPDNLLGHGIANAEAAADYVFSSVDPRHAVPSIMDLSAFPNPVNGIVNVVLTLEKSQTGTLALFDVLGRQVTTLSNETFGAGSTSLTLPVDGYASGRYFISFTGAQQSATVPLTILK
jgi:serine protease AprX